MLADKNKNCLPWIYLPNELFLGFLDVFNTSKTFIMGQQQFCIAGEFCRNGLSVSLNVRGQSLSLLKPNKTKREAIYFSYEK